ncbi:MAG: NfeD family protein [Sphingomonas sp.]|uniref:NfeD family protein n=1 Tax=Sphingomonas sp. TaxID=28214 RepID=UPI0025E97D54|nr:NfeD family protein [Sphingomonas sp.]MBY0283767.1 NfeD family protein [Sphingomonas sp.]
MSSSEILGSAGLVWIMLAVALVIGELASPGIFLIFLAAGALVTGVTMLALPDIPFLVQLVSFTAWSAVAVAIGRRWYTQFPVATSDAMLNDRSARLVGEIVTVVAALDGGEGRVRVGDGEWRASGSTADVGVRMRVVAVRDGVLIVESLPPGV